MSRNRVIALCGVLALLAAVLPLVLASWLAWQGAQKAEQTRLQDIASWALLRTERALGGATAALVSLQGEGPPACSAEHIAQLRALAVTTPYIEEVGYFAGGRLQCSSWGEVREAVAATATDFTTADGIEVTTAVQALVGRGASLVALRQGAYNVLILPSRLVDVLTEGDVRIGLRAPNGQWVAHTGGGAADAFGQPPQAGWQQAEVSRNGWQAVVMQPRERFNGALGQELLWLLPIGALTAALLVGLVVWLGRKRLSPLAELALAVQHEEFVVHYQPLIHLASGACVGAEALVRWQRPDGSMVRPDLFIPLAEDSGLVQPITDQVVRGVLRDLGPLLNAERSLHVAVNLCAEDLQTGRILPVIEQALQGTGVRPEQLWLEATERGFIDVDSATRTIETARGRGHAVAIDDFGTGYSSLQYLQGLPLDALKIDKSFIDTIGVEAATSAVTEHIIGMARELGLFIVAEGVETQAQADYLKARQVDFGQGWLFAKALPAAEFIAFFQRCKAQSGAGPEVVQARREGVQLPLGSLPATE
ncbi:EAL domain-containing protein [Pseudomonas sp. NPDC007930]|uniref:EAL domain-containing protein n=1 Tax=Pseudomonas sp. NPDC007930 TaxID=3364417 RepID=UPI0036E13F74